MKELTPFVFTSIHYNLVFLTMINLIMIIVCMVLRRSFQMNEKDLLDKLMMDHSALARPVRNVSTPVVVKFGLEILHIVSVVESEQTVLQKVRTHGIVSK